MELARAAALRGARVRHGELSMIAEIQRRTPHRDALRDSRRAILRTMKSRDERRMARTWIAWRERHGAPVCGRTCPALLTGYLYARFGKHTRRCGARAPTGGVKPHRKARQTLWVHYCADDLTQADIAGLIPKVMYESPDEALIERALER